MNAPGTTPTEPCADAGTHIPRSPEETHWQKRSRLYRLRDEVARLASEIRRDEQQRARAKLKRLPPHQRRVLQSIVSDHWNEEAWCFGFKTLGSWSGLNRTQVSRACKALRRLGFVEYHRGLFNDDGEVAGSGYRISKAGHAWWWEREQPASSSEIGDHIARASEPVPHAPQCSSGDEQ